MGKDGRRGPGVISRMFGGSKQFYDQQLTNDSEVRPASSARDSGWTAWSTSSSREVQTGPGASGAAGRTVTESRRPSAPRYVAVPTRPSRREASARPSASEVGGRASGVMLDPGVRRYAWFVAYLGIGLMASWCGHLVLRQMMTGSAATDDAHTAYDMAGMMVRCILLALMLAAWVTSQRLGTFRGRWFAVAALSMQLIIPMAVFLALHGPWT